MTAERPFQIQLFHSSGKRDFLETRSQVQTVPSGESTVSFNVNVLRLKALRLDFGSNPGKVRVSRVRLRGRDGWRDLRLDNFGSFNDIESHEIANGILTVRSTKVDPFIIYEGCDLDCHASRHLDGVGALVFWLLASVAIGFLSSCRSFLVRAYRFRYVIWAALFAALVGCGVSLSNLGALDTLILTRLDGYRLLCGECRRIRWDEFAGHGLMPAIQHYNAKPQFPRYNAHVGLAGRDDLIMIDAGTPIKHIAMIGRPATWGFFLFDLRRSLSWYSLLPVFFSVFCFWFLFDTLRRENGWLNFLAAAACVFTLNSSCVTFYSAHSTAGSMLAVASMLRMLRSENRRAILCWGLLMGWGGLVSALTIYFPRVWYGAIMAGALFLGACLEEGLWRRFRSRYRILAIALGLLLMAAVLGIWYVSAADAIESMRNTVYPGQRRVLGGSMKLWELFLGWVATLTAYREWLSGVNNQCEIQAPLFILSSLVLVCWFFVRRLVRPWTVVAVWAYVALLYIFCYCQWPAWLAKITLLELCTCQRSDYFVSIAQIVLMVLLMRNLGTMSFSDRGAREWFRYLMAAVLIVLPALTLFDMPGEVWSGIQGAVAPRKWHLQVGCSLVVYLLLSCLLLRWFRLGCILFLCLEVAIGLKFNPISVAPEKLDSPLLKFVEGHRDLWRNRGRVLFCDDVRESNLYAAAGGMVMNGFFDYGDPVIANTLFASEPDVATFNRWHQMLVVLATKGDEAFKAEVLTMDVVKVTFHARKYDFSALPVDYLVTRDCVAVEVLKRNPSVRFLREFADWSLFAVSAQYQ